MLPVVGGTSCTCKNKKLTWNADTQVCECADPTTQIFVAAPVANCITCDATVNAEGIDAENAGKCACPIGTFIDGRCSCGKTSAFLIDDTGAIAGCANCKDSAKYLKNRKNEKECNCVSSALKWDGIKGVCACPDSKVPYGKTSSLKCATCKGANVVGPFDPILEPDADVSKCACPTADFTYSITNAGVPSCTCTAKNSIVTFAQECLVCPAVVADGGLGVILTAHECKCTNSFFWSYIGGACKKCSEDPSAKISGGNNVACACLTGFVWDVVT
jgi:hypothetical protein